MLGAVKVGEVEICGPLAALSGVLGIVVPGTAAGGGFGVPVSVLGVWAPAAPTKIRLDATSATDDLPIMRHLPGAA